MGPPCWCRWGKRGNAATHLLDGGDQLSGADASRKNVLGLVRKHDADGPTSQYALTFCCWIGLERLAFPFYGEVVWQEDWIGLSTS